MATFQPTDGFLAGTLQAQPGPQAKPAPAPAAADRNTVIRRKAEESAMARRIEQFKQTDYYKRTQGKGTVASDAVNQAVINAGPAARGAASIVGLPLKALAYGFGKLGLKQGERFYDDVTRTQLNLLSSKRVMTVREMDHLADMAEAMGRTEEALDLRHKGEVYRIANMSDREVFEAMQDKGITRKVVSALSGMIPSIAVAAGAGPSSAAARASLASKTTAAGKTAQFVKNNAVADAVFAAMERDPDAPFARQARQMLGNFAAAAVTEATLGGAFFGGQAAFRGLFPGKALSQADEARHAMVKAVSGEPLTRAEEDRLLGHVAEKRLAGEPLLPTHGDQTALLAEYFGTEPDDVLKAIREIGTGRKLDEIEAGLSAKFGKSYDGYVAFVERTRSPQTMIGDLTAVEAARLDAERLAGVEPAGVLGAADEAIPDGQELRAARALFRAPAKPPLLARVAGGTRDMVNKVRESFISRYLPLRQMQKDLIKKSGQANPLLWVDERFEDFAGAGAQAEADIRAAWREVGDAVKHMPDKFQDYAFLKRTIDRLQTNADERAVGSWTMEKAQRALEQLRAEIGDEAFATLEVAGNRYQKVMDGVMRLQVESGRMSEKLYESLRGQNQWYAPFKVMREMIEADDAGSAFAKTKSMSSTKKVTEKVTGIGDDDFLLADIWEESMNQIYRGRLLAEKNRRMLQVHAMKDMPGADEYMRVLGAAEKPPRGWKTSVAYVDGREVTLALDPRIAGAVQGLNAQMTGFIRDSLSIGSKPLRTGATIANVPFQMKNVLRDTKRLFTKFRYGNTMPDLVKFPYDLLRGFYHSMAGNAGFADEWFDAFLRSGAAGGDLSTQIRPGVPRSVMERYGRRLNVLDSAAKLSRAFEQTPKLAGYIRGIRDVNRSFGSASKHIDEALFRRNPLYKESIEAMFHEVRNYAGSPDFARAGNLSPDAGLLFMFFNARMQGTAADLGRLAGVRGKGTAKAWAATTAVTLPVIYNHIRNRLNYSEDYDRLTKWEKDNYVVMFLDSTFVNDQGEEVRDALRFPKGDWDGGIWTVIENGMDYAFTQDPQAFLRAGEAMLLNHIPVNLDGDTIVERGESLASGLNPVMKVPLEIALNRDTFRHRDLVPDNYKNVDLQAVSTDRQFRDTTPEVFRAPSRLFTQATGVEAPSPLSPIRLEHAFSGLTGGFTRQFNFQEPLAGRSRLSANPITGWAFRSQWTSDPESQKTVAGILKQQENFKFDDVLAAERFLREIEPLSRTERADRLEELDKRDPKLFDRVLKTIEAKKKGLSYTERLLAQAQVKNGARAAAIHRLLQKVPRQDRPAFLRDLDRKGILSETVWEQVKRLSARP